MSALILHDAAHDRACMYDPGTRTAFGPVVEAVDYPAMFPTAGDALRSFVAYLVDGLGQQDVAALHPDTLARQYASWSERVTPGEEEGDEGAPFTAEQAKQLRGLRSGGWRIGVLERDETTRELLVDGLDNNGDAFRGRINAAGILVGEPVDSGRAPERFGVSLPVGVEEFGPDTRDDKELAW